MSTSRRLVLMPGASVPKDRVSTSNESTSNSERQLHHVNVVVDHQGNELESNANNDSQVRGIKENVAKCRMLLADLEISSISIIQLVEEGSFTKAAIDMELSELQKMADDYSTAHLEIIRVCELVKKETKEFDDRRQRFLLRYKQVRNQLLASVPPTSIQQLDSSGHLKLPKVEIPIFDGDFTQWSGWFKLFESLIHKNESLDNMAKFSYFRSRLKGVPLTLVESYPFAGEYYEAAYATVVCHYDDPLKQISRLLDNIQNTATMKDKKQSLRGLITIYRANVTALQVIFSQNKKIDPVSQLFIHSFLAKADKGTRTDWEREMTRRKSFASFSEFVQYIEGRCNAFERASMGSSSNNTNTESVSQVRSKVLSTTARKRKCFHCGEEHTIYKCSKFRSLSVADRKKVVADKKLCMKCLSPYCKRTCPINCGKCKKDHNILVHDIQHNQNTGNKLLELMSFEIEVPSKNTCVDLSKSTTWIGNTSNNLSEALLATTQCKILNNGNNYLCRALVDSASQSNLITKNLVKRLNLEIQSSSVQLGSIGNHQSSSLGSVEVHISAKNTQFAITIWCEIVDDILDVVPTYDFDIQNWDIPKNIQLADTKFNISSRIDLLLGLRIFWRTLGNKMIRLGKNLPCLRSSKFGWLVTDIRDVDEWSRNLGTKHIFATQIQDNLSETFKLFWFLDEFESTVLSFEELECERIYATTTTRNISGKFMVKLPFGIPAQKLGHSRSLALKCFFQLEKRFIKNPVLKIEYVKCMEDYIKLNHMREIKNENLEDLSYYMPHHAVIKETSTSTKLRAVFNASMPTTSGLSLNNCLLVGPVIQSDLISIIMRFRIHKVVFTADIVKMYRQIIVHPDDTRFQRIFWRFEPNDPLKVYEITTLAFGTASAPFLATRCLKALADLDGDKFPAARPVLLRDFYMDDVLTGADSLEAVIDIKNQLIKILAGAGFELSKWCSNKEELLLQIPENQRENNFPFSVNKDEKVVKSLGLLFFPSNDSYQIKVQIGDFSSARTKRDILSIIASVFDPLGLISPVTVIAKLLIQSLWSSAKSPCSPQSDEHWKEKVSDIHWQQWIKFASTLDQLHDVSIPRHIFLNCNSFSRIELHGFSDASERAYGAVVYIRAIGNNEFSSCLFFSKSRVAPIKKQSLPRLELCAAVLLGEVIEKVRSVLKDIIKIDIIRLWSDSQIVLHWIASPSNRWLPFVANRVQKIQNFSNDCFWDYVNTKSNPADLISRGVTPSDLKNSVLWWQGPEWLSSAEYFTSEVKFVPSKKPLDIEIRHSKRSLVFATVFKSSIFKQTSNYWKLVRIVAWISRFFWNLHWLGPHISGPLQIFEVRESIRTLVRLSQLEYFSVDFKRLKSDTGVDKSSPLTTLNPFLDHHNIIRVGRRLQNSELSYDRKHPYVLDHRHELSKLIIRYYHELYFHAGPQLLRSIIRSQFWILRINSAIRQCILQCHKCIRLRAESRQQTMAALPKSRVTPNKPFAVTGVDYAGPFSIIGKGGRHKVMVKAYIAVFVCFATKAFHLELVSDLTSEAFLAALTRFISRRGIPNEIHSDNGTNFVGANSLLKKQFKEFMLSNFDKISNFAASKSCQWHFIPPHAPHFGGLWEAGVKAVKGQLQFVLSKDTFTFEQWVTLLAQIEACLNSRPLIPESNDPNDVSALTPGHFLIGCPILDIPHADLKDVPTNRLKYWTLVKSQSQKFWKRWSNEYLNTLQQRFKWRLTKDAVKINDLVIIREDNTHPTSWPLARITELHPGSDGHIRVVTLRTASGIIKRPIVKIIPLPSEESYN